MASSNEHVVIRISDTGIGIPRQDLRVFERFYVVDKSRSRKLGNRTRLSIVKHIVSFTMVALMLRAAPVGTTFTVTLPVKQEE
jgi:two-component system phosphate regulon sensor histidine kinase PhoR